ELRAKSGLLRGREFLMKDMYSFHENQEDFDKFYEIAKQAYLKIFQRLGLTAKVTEASGGSFSQKISYEFMVLTDAGEDDILYCDVCEFCVNKDIAKQNEKDPCPKCGKGKLTRATASEVGNVFDLGQKYGKDFGLTFADKDGNKIYPVMGCYGIGISRLMGVIVEKTHDDKGVVWPEGVAPFKIHLLQINGADASGVYEKLQAAGGEVLYDNREANAGEKFADADLLGIPWRAVVSPKTGEKIELKRRSESETKLVSLEELIKLMA
ncbi:MAG: aminoacyl--tRNA ligase-related protein, partial [Candidatus Liptonbacteria bacterium]